MKKIIVSTTGIVAVLLVCSLYVSKEVAPEEEIQYFDFSLTPMVISVRPFVK